MMLRVRVAVAMTVAGLALCATPAYAVSYTPFLHLDIKQGVYDNTTQSTGATTNAWTLYAYLTPPAMADGVGMSLNELLRDGDYITAALTPKAGPTSASLGSFTFNSTTVNATADMVFGTAPADAISETKGDIPRPDLYDTFFQGFAPFRLRTTSGAIACTANADCANPSDVSVPKELVQPTPNSAVLQDERMYYMAFTVDTSSLNPNYQVHIDLYSTGGETDTSGNRDIKYMAGAAAERDARSRAKLRRER